LVGAILANREQANAAAAERAGSSGSSGVGKAVVKAVGSAAAKAAAQAASQGLRNYVAEKQAAPATRAELEAEREFGYMGTHGVDPDYTAGVFQDASGNVWNNGKLVYDASTSNYFSDGSWFDKSDKMYSSPLLGGIDFANPSTPSFADYGASPASDYGFSYPSVTGAESSPSWWDQPSSDYNNYDFKDGGSVAMMKDGGVPHMADGGLMDILAQYLPAGVMDYINAASGNVSGTVLGAGAGAALGKLLSGMTQTSGGVNQGVDMSKVGNIAPKTTSFGMGPAKYVGYDQYGSQGGSDVYANTDLYRDLGTPMNAPQGGLSSVPKMAGGGAVHFTYGTPIDPMQMMQDEQPMQGMRDGGMPESLGHPMVEGRMDYRQGSYVSGPGDGQSDDIPAMLADGEYVFDSDTVAALGNGSNKAGAAALDKMRENIRAHKRKAPVNKIPPPAKSPLAYLKGMK
jgi:hypothetical protein